MATSLELKELVMPWGGTHSKVDQKKERVGRWLQPRWGQRREPMVRHITSFLAGFGPVMLLLGLGVVCRAGVVLEMLR